MNNTRTSFYLITQDMCLELQCMVPGRSEAITNHTPALDGTKCGSGRGVVSYIVFQHENDYTFSLWSQQIV